MNIGIIGTAGRGDDFNKLTPIAWRLMNVQLIGLIKYLKPNKLISGGAAFADHTAVMYYLHGLVPDISVKMPCYFDENGFDKSKDGGISNYYHGRFSTRVERDSINELKQVIHKMEFGSGFFNRNDKIAKESDILIAATFGEETLLKDGGTAHTMGQFIERNGNQNTFHLDLNQMKLFKGAKVNV